MLTKQELVKIAIREDIRFKKSWSKAQLEAALASGIKNSDPIWIDCKLCGVRFDAIEYGVTEATTVHPELSRWSRTALKHGWYAAYQLCLEYCKEHKFETIEQVKAVLSKAENGEDWSTETESVEVVEIPYNLILSDTKKNTRKSWVALLTGLDEQFGFARKFVETASLEGRDRYFNLEYLGYYESKSYTSKGDSSVSYWKIEKPGESPTKCSYQEVVEAIGDPDAVKREQKAFWEELDRKTVKLLFRGKLVNDVIFLDGTYYFVIRTGWFVEDIDGLCWDSDRSRGSGEDTFSEYPGYYCRLATEAEIEAYQQAIVQQETLKATKTEFGQFIDHIKSKGIRSEGSDTPTPQGIEVPYTPGRTIVIETTGRTWHLLANDRSIGKYLDLDREEVNRLLQVIEILELPVN